MTAEATALVQQAGQQLARTIEELEVVDAPSFQVAAGYLVQVKSFLRCVDTLTAPVISAARAAKDAAVASLKAAQEQDQILRAPALNAEGVLKTKVVDYETLARARVDAERTARASEHARLQVEANLEADLEAEATGRPVVAAPVFVAPVAAAPVAKAEGVSFREIWDFELEDLAAVPREYLLVDEVRVRAVVRALKSLTRIPGVRVFSRRIAAVRVSP